VRDRAARTRTADRAGRAGDLSRRRLLDRLAETRIWRRHGHDRGRRARRVPPTRARRQQGVRDRRHLVRSPDGVAPRAAEHTSDMSSPIAPDLPDRLANDLPGDLTAVRTPALVVDLAAFDRNVDVM